MYSQPNNHTMYKQKWNKYYHLSWLKNDLLLLVFDEQKNIDAESKRAAAARDKALEQEKAIKKPTVKGTDSTAAASSKAEETETTVHVPAAISNKKRPGDKVEKATDDFFYEKFKKRARDSWRYQ